MVPVPHPPRDVGEEIPADAVLPVGGVTPRAGPLVVPGVLLLDEAQLAEERTLRLREAAAAGRQAQGMG